MLPRPALLGFCVWTATLWAVALPAQAQAGPAAQEAEDVVVVVDNSGSMRRNDPDSLALLAVQRFVERRAADTRVALLVFDETARLVVPLAPSDDAARERFAAALDEEVTYRGRWTNLPAAIERALYHLRTDGREGTRRSIVFLTDGRVDTGDAERDEELEDWLSEGLADSAADAGVRLFGIAFTEDADYRVIESVTRRTDGEYVRVFEAAALNQAFDRIEAASVPDAPVEAPAESQTEVQEPAPEAPDAPVSADGPVTVEGGRAEPASSAAPAWVIAAALAFLALSFGVFFFMRRRRAAPASSAPRRAVEVPKAYLMDTSGASGRVRHDLGEMTVIGRKASDRDVVSVVIDRDTVSRRHASVRFRGGTFWITDHRTRNGTFVNGERVTEERPLEPGDIVRIDKHELVFDVEQWESEDVTRYGEDDEATRFNFEASVTPVSR